jgi:enoyl-CoA hydratase/carnithine racemase
MPVSDNWSFVLDVLFCGLTLAALRYARASNMPYWKVDKYVRRTLGPNPIRAHDAIGAAGANFLTWSCLHHLSEHYGPVFTPAEELVYRKDSGQDWYPLNHLRPVVNWSMTADEEGDYLSWLLGPVLQMTSLMLHENRAHLSHMNAIGELCAQFRSGVLAMIRKMGADAAIDRVEAYHKLHPEAATSSWYPETFSGIESPEWQQLYVNAEHDGSVGAISISREAYNSDVDTELNRAINWLRSESIDRVIVTGDFHLSTQMVGADTSDFYPALSDEEKGVELSSAWSRTARRLHEEFKVSIGFVNGKRCLGGMLELMMHCHYLVAVDDASLGMPEVTLPVVPGMEGCHWPLRKAGDKYRSKVLHLLMTGESVKSGDAVNWLVDYAGSVDDCVKKVWQIASDGNHGLSSRKVIEEAIQVSADIRIPSSADYQIEQARHAIMECISQSCAVPLSKALAVQAKHAGGFMAAEPCQKGIIGSEAEKIMNV